MWSPSPAKDQNVKKSTLMVLTAAAAMILVSVAEAQAPRKGDAENGRRLFEKDGCYECHGHAGQGGKDGPRIAATPLSAQTFVRYVRRPSGAMPAYTPKVLSDEELTDIHAYLKAFPAPKPAKDIQLLNQLRDK
ncbi:MAG: hypothetical protein DMG59_01200 [Acidobacteria bacterium]|nr:MAG: hypothetical protein DMG59_01200 [Acidobacteriota bacterium]